MNMMQYFHISLEVWGAVFCGIAALAMWISHTDKSDRVVIHMELTVVGLLLLDAMAWTFRGYPGEVGFYMVRISNFCVFVLTYVLSMQYTDYVISRIENKVDFPVNTWQWAVYMVGLLGIAMVVTNLFSGTFYYFDANNFYHRTDSYFLLMVVGFVNIVLDLMLMIINRKCFKPQMFWSLMSYLVLPILAGVFQTFHYGMSLLNISIAVSMLFIFLAWEIDKTQQQVEQKNVMAEQKERIAQQEKEITQMQQDIMLSQIQPHFLYNSLTAIAQLCEKKPMEAKKVTIAFAEYLRGNMNALKTKEPVPFTQELDHVENYLALERMRFGDDLEIIFDIETVDFCVPVLTVQPIVENAIKHGIHRKGTVVISSREQPDGFEVRVEDDGVGFNPMEGKPGDGRNHVGIVNVGQRIRDLCGGSLTYKSTPGKGTIATLWIPKKIKKI